MAEVKSSPQYEKLRSYWHRNNAKHVQRLKQQMTTWIVEERCKQEDLEKRLRFFTFVAKVAAKDTEGLTEDGAKPTSYLKAVATGRQTTETKESAELTRLYELCTTPMETLAAPRPSTEDEDRALLLILNHELEVPYPPRFLVQTMTGGEIARFIDIFKAIEYPLYAHLAPGQRFGENLPKQVILAQIHMGVEAAYSQKQAIAAFKEDLSRISLDVNTRVLTVYFKGKPTAMKWKGWQLPLAMKLLRLIDYEGQREDAKYTNAIVRLDYYEFTVVLRKGAMTSTDLHWLLSTKMGLKVHTMAHTEIKDGGLNDKQWIISIKAAACPPKLRKIGYIQIGDVELLVHHHEVHLNWPCTTCGAPNHPAKYCRVTEDELEANKAQHHWRVAGYLPSVTQKNQGSEGRIKTPTTLAELRALLKGDQPDSNQATKESTGKQQQRSTRTSPVRAESERAAEWTDLPKEWEQHKPPHDWCDDEEKGGDDEQEDARNADGVDNNKDGQYVQPRTIPQPNSPHSWARTEETTRETEQEPTEWKAEPNDVDMETPDASGVEEQTQANREHQNVMKMGTARSPIRGRSPTRRPLTARQRKGNHERQQPKGAAHKQETGYRDTKTTGTTVDYSADKSREILTRERSTRPKSYSPKRRVPDTWASDTESMADQRTCFEGAKAQKREGTARSTSPLKRANKKPENEGKVVMQKYIHQFLQHVQGGGTQDEEMRQQKTTEPDAGEPTNVHAQSTTAQINAATEESEDESSQYCEYIQSKPPTDPGMALQTILDLLEGEVTDVVSNGHCGWLAYHAAYTNQRLGHIPLKAPNVKAANEFKKDIMNNVIANLRDELQLHPTVLQTELVASSNADAVLMTSETQVQVLATHYVEQRKISVRVEATPELWVRPTHIKGMAMHAREEIYVLDVDADNIAHVQVYAYQEEDLPTGERVETGTVTTLETKVAMGRLGALAEVGWCPIVMILQWQKMGNHFKAVTYAADRHRRCTDAKQATYDKINEILVKHGGWALDRVPYDSDMTASAAKNELSAITKAAKKELTDKETDAKISIVSQDEKSKMDADAREEKQAQTEEHEPTVEPHQGGDTETLKREAAATRDGDRKTTTGHSTVPTQSGEVDASKKEGAATGVHSQINYGVTTRERDEEQGANHGGELTN